MPRPRTNALFELGEQWIAKDPDSNNLYRFWFDAGTGRTRRSSLGTQNLEEAKLIFAQIVLKGAPHSVEVPLSLILEKYFEDRTDKMPSAAVSRSAGRILLTVFGPTIKAKELTEARQKLFVQRCLDDGFKLSYAARVMTVLRAAIRHAKLIEIEIVSTEPKMIAVWGFKSAPVKKAYKPSDDELARLLAADISDLLRRWVVISMLTGCRPSAGLELTPAQRIKDARLLDLNPLDRAQNKKHRALVRETRVLRRFLDYWSKEATSDNAPFCGGADYDGLKTVFDTTRDRKDVDIPQLSTYSFRHKVATVLRRARVPEDQVSLQLGHRRKDLRITAEYGEWDPSYLATAARALDAWFLRVWRNAEQIRLSRVKHDLEATLRNTFLKPLK